MKILKNLVSVTLIGSMAMALCSCSKIEKVEKDGFIEVVTNKLDITEEELLEKEFDFEDCNFAFAYNGDVKIMYVEYKGDKAKGAKDEIESMKAGHDDSDFSGTSASVNLNSYGYYIYNGTKKDLVSDDNERLTDYGGIYYSENIVYRIFTNDDDSKETVDSILDELGFPKP